MSFSSAFIVCFARTYSCWFRMFIRKMSVLQVHIVVGSEYSFWPWALAVHLLSVGSECLLYALITSTATEICNWNLLFLLKFSAFMSKNGEWWTRRRNYRSCWIRMSIWGLLFQWYFLPYFSNLFTIQLRFLPYFPNLITIQLTLLLYFPYLFTIQSTFLSVPNVY